MEFCQPDVIVHRRLVYFHDLYLSREDGFLDEQREVADSRIRQQFLEFCILLGVQAETVLVVRRIIFRLSARPCPCCFLHTHEIFGLYFFLFQNPRLWSGFPRPSGRTSWFLSDKRLFVGQGHNLLCSLEQRILLWSDCRATFTVCCGPAKSVPFHCLIPILQN